MRRWSALGRGRRERSAVVRQTTSHQKDATEACSTACSIPHARAPGRGSQARACARVHASARKYEPHHPGGAHASRATIQHLVDQCVRVLNLRCSVRRQRARDLPAHALRRSGVQPPQRERLCTEHEVVAGDGRACAERRGRNVAVAAAVGAEALLQGFEALGLAVLLPLVERLARDGDDGRRLVGGGGLGGLRGRRRRGSVWGLGGGPMDKARDLELCVLVPPLQLQSSPCGTMRAVCCELHESSASRCSLKLLLRCSAIEMGPHLRRERAHPVTSALEAAMTIEAARLRGCGADDAKDAKQAQAEHGHSSYRQRPRL